MVRTPSFDKNGIKKGAWSPEEDAKLQAYIKRYGHSNWRELPKFAGLQRCGKSCRLRWMNYLRPNVRRGGYTTKEEDLIVELHQKHGNKWSMIAGRLPGRTDNEIKNYWHTHLKKRRGKSSDNCHVSSLPSDNMSSDITRSTQRHLSSSRGSRIGASMLPSDPTVLSNDECFKNIPILESSSLSSAPTVSSSTAVGRTEGGGVTDEVDMSDEFWFGSEFTPLDDRFDLTTFTNNCNSGTDYNTDYWTAPFTVEEMMSPYDISSLFTHDSTNIHQQLLYYDQSNVDFFHEETNSCTSAPP